MCLYAISFTVFEADLQIYWLPVLLFFTITCIIMFFVLILNYFNMFLFLRQYVYYPINFPFCFFNGLMCILYIFWKCRDIGEIN